MLCPVAHSDTDRTSFLWVSGLRLAVPGDVVYNEAEFVSCGIADEGAEGEVVGGDWEGEVVWASVCGGGA